MKRVIVASNDLNKSQFQLGATYRLICKDGSPAERTFRVINLSQKNKAIKVKGGINGIFNIKDSGNCQVLLLGTNRNYLSPTSEDIISEGVVKAESEIDNDDLSDIKNAVSNAVKEYMCGPRGGFDEYADPEDKYSMPWTDYASIEVNDAGDNYIEVRVNAELSYEGFENMFELLNPVVERWDSEAYFDMEDSGRAVALINTEA